MRYRDACVSRPAEYVTCPGELPVVDRSQSASYDTHMVRVRIVLYCKATRLVIPLVEHGVDRHVYISCVPRLGGGFLYNCGYAYVSCI